nr:NADH dehydrogenase subunit 6 [Metoecus cf. javanus JL-2021a]
MVLNTMLSIMFLTMKHPLSMGVTLLVQTILISLLTGSLNFNFWYSYILFLIMVGGMLVLFTYMTSVASNEKFKMNYNSLLFLMALMTTLPLLLYYFTILFKTKFNNELYSQMNIQPIMNTFLNKYFNYPSNILLYFVIIYLLISLIAIVKISNLTQGPLRHTNLNNT